MKREFGLVARFVLALFLLYSFPFSSRGQSASKSASSVLEEEAYVLGTQAYIYYTAPFILYNILYQGQQLPYMEYKEGVPFNCWTRVNQLGNFRNTGNVVMPNCNTLYAAAWLDLRKEPVLLDIPASGGRYFSIALMDAYSNNFSILGSNTIGPFPSKILICSNDYSGAIPDGYKKVIAPTPLIWAVQRVAPGKAVEAEVQACRNFQEQVKLIPLSQVDNKDYQADRYNQKLNLGKPDLKADPLAFFGIASKFVKLNKPPVEDEGLLSSFAGINLSATQDFDPSKLAPEQRRGLLRAMETGAKIIESFLKKGNGIYNGWVLPPSEAGSYGTNYLLRAAYAVERVGVLLPSEAMYLTAYTDTKGQVLNGENNYVIHFEKNELPEVNAFWSIILYDLPSILFYDNPMDRYQMGPQIPEMKFNADGSLDIYIQHAKPTKPGQLGNWLPAPKGPFMLTLRLYNPKPAMMKIGEGLTNVPGIMKSSK
jgi:hypothetical protein